MEGIAAFLTSKFNSDLLSNLCEPSLNRFFRASVPPILHSVTLFSPRQCSPSARFVQAHMMNGVSSTPRTEGINRFRYLQAVTPLITHQLFRTLTRLMRLPLVYKPYHSFQRGPVSSTPNPQKAPIGC